jgi:FKBP-type peptidyl-prolyl cis-trans isomerase FklB
MKQLAIFIAVVIFGSTALAQDKATAQGSTQLKDQKDKVSYSIGLNIGFSMAKENVDVNADALASGIRDALAGKPQMTEDQVKATMSSFEKDMQDKMTTKGKEAAAAGDKFLAENKSKPGMKATASGLQYKVLKEGSGATPKATDRVKVNYRGTLIDGTEFDSSYKRGEPLTLPVNGVIKGWSEALQMMKVGSKYQLFIPASLAYGERGAGAQIPPNSALIFEVELLDIVQGSAATGAPPAAASASPSATAKP